jgi:hypothetical protein
VEFDAKGGVNNTVVTPAMLGLQPRDVSLFKTTAGPGKQRATISVRKGRILFRSEHCQAIIVQDRAYLFPSRHVSEVPVQSKPSQGAPSWACIQAGLFVRVHARPAEHQVLTGRPC